jgi:hypothetical protein
MFTSATAKFIGSLSETVIPLIGELIKSSGLDESTLNWKVFDEFRPTISVANISSS